MANNITIIGRLGQDGEGRVTPSGTAVFSFSVAEDVGFGDKKTTNWWKVQLWGKQAESKVVDYLVKGQQVVVFGEVTMREWEDKNGNKRLSPEIRANAIQLAGSKGDNASPSQYSEPPKQKTAAEKHAEEVERSKSAQFEDDDIPF